MAFAQVNTVKLDLKEKQKAYDAALAELRRLARSRLEDNPLFSTNEDME